MKALITLSTLALIIMTGIASFILFAMAEYTLSALLVGTFFLSISAWIYKVNRKEWALQ